MIVRIPPTHPKNGINPTEPPTINKTDGAGVTRSSSL